MHGREIQEVDDTLYNAEFGVLRRAASQSGPDKLGTRPLYSLPGYQRSAMLDFR